MRNCASWLGVLGVFVASTAAAHPAREIRHQHIAQGLRGDPCDARLLMSQGRLNVEAGAWSQAMRDYDLAERCGGDAAALAVARGKAYLVAGRPVLAEMALEGAVGSLPNAVGARLLRAQARAAQGRFGAAAQDQRKALSQLRHPTPGQRLTLADWWMQAGEPGRALDVLDSGLTQQPAVVTLAVRAVEIELMQDRVNRALARLDMLCRRTRFCGRWQLWQAQILAAVGRVGEARERFDEARKALAEQVRGGRSSRALDRMLVAARRGAAASRR